MSLATINTTTEEELLLTLEGSPLKALAEKVLQKQRLNFEDGLMLLTTVDLLGLQRLADFVRHQRVGNTVYYSSTLYIHPTNLCELSCPLCSYYAKPGWDKAWFLTPEDVEKKIRATLTDDVIEIHIVGGLWRECNLDYYKDVFKRIHAINPKLHIKALTPVEYDFLANLHGISVEEVLQKMMEWGLGSLPGGGAEVLVEAIRKRIAPEKITSDRYLEIHRIAHLLGLPSNVTMLFGHIEEPKDLATHLQLVRDLQDETHGFQAFVPLKYHEENNALGKRKNILKPKEIRRIYAAARLFLDNIPHIKALWNYLGVKEALEMLSWGANDLSSTNQDEKIISMAGGGQNLLTSQAMEEKILESGKIPCKIHSRYTTHYKASTCCD